MAKPRTQIEYNRILWDPSYYSPEDVIIGYLDRFQGVKEMNFSDFVENRDPTDPVSIPMHRIRYFKHISTGEMIYERDSQFLHTSS